MLDPSRYVGLPFTPRGRSREEGVDCWGLVRLVYRETWGIELPSYLEDDYQTADTPEVARLMDRHKADGWYPVAPGEECAGDVLLLQMDGLPCHVGIVTRPGWMVHARDRANVVCERYSRPHWRHRVMGIYRYARP